MARFGFNLKVPRKWNKAWLLMWLFFTAGLITLAFFVPFWPSWLLSSIPLFFVPEIIGIIKKDDAYPPLTHTIRHFLPNWVAFPLIYFFVGSIGAEWLEFARPLHLGGLFALLGWLTDHFSVTYAGKDPYPTRRRGEVTPAELEPQGVIL